MKQILLADDHSLVRKGLVFVLTTRLNCTDPDEVESLSELMQALKKREYSHLILDLSLGDGMSLEILPHIRQLYPKLQILVFTMQPVEIYGSVAEKYGIRYFVSKSLGDKEVTQLLQAFLNDEKQGDSHSMEFPDESPFKRLSPREVEVLHYILEGLRSSEIGRRLNMEVNTISTFKRRIYEKTGTSNEVQLRELVRLYKFDKRESRKLI